MKRETARIMKSAGQNLKMRRWNYKSLFIIILSIILAAYILTSSSIKIFILSSGNLNYIGAFISGIFFAFGFTAAPATASILLIGKTMNPLLLGLIGGLGAMLSDFLIFSYVKEGLSPDLKYILKKSKLDKIKKLRYTKIGWIVPLIAGLIIASPLPDEIGSFIFSISKYPIKKFLVISYLLNSLGIFIIALLA